MKRGCFIALWALGTYALTWLAADVIAGFTHQLLAPRKLPGRLMESIKLATEFSHYLLPYLAGAVVFAVGLGGHLPGTRIKN